MVVLFGKGRSTVTEHIANEYEEGELLLEPTCRKFRQVGLEGKREVGRAVFGSVVMAFTDAAERLQLLNDGVFTRVYYQFG